ncbi:MAG: transcriptional repressor [Rhizobiaceae bacterium]|nr:transcriptional repressor [Rhizobiaceae bacterium]
MDDQQVVDNSQLAQKLRNAGLRPTRQRTALAELLFKKGDRHVSAECLFEDAKKAQIVISLATVYNTLNQFSEAGLLRTISIDSTRVYFDTKTGDHHHFFLEDSEQLVDMPEGCVRVENLPDAPPGTEVSRVDVIVRVRSTK